MRPALVALVVFFMLLTGALGLTTVEECDNPADNHAPSDSERISCYHLAAITAAYLQDANMSSDICARIWMNFGDPAGNPDKDVVGRAELETNNCYFDIAKITRKPDYCYYVQKRTADIGSGLSGDTATREMCLQEAGNLSQLQPENYFQNNPDSLCALVFIMPFLVLGALHYSSRA